MLKDAIPGEKTKYSGMALQCKGVSEGNTTGAHRLRGMAANGELLFLPSTFTTA